MTAADPAFDSASSLLTQAFNNGYAACYKAHDLGDPTDAKSFNIRNIVAEVTHEVLRATKMFKPMNSPHEASAVILEEYDEFWDEVKAFNLRKGRDNRPRMREELIQLAAMAVRAITDTIDFAKSEEPKTMILAPLPAGIEDTPTNRARLQALAEGRNGFFNQAPMDDSEKAGKQ